MTPWKEETKTSGNPDTRSAASSESVGAAPPLSTQTIRMSSDGVFPHLVQFVFGKTNVAEQNVLNGSFTLMLEARSSDNRIDLRRRLIMCIRSIGLLATREFAFLAPLGRPNRDARTVNLSTKDLRAYSFKNVKTGWVNTPISGSIGVPGLITKMDRIFETVSLMIQLVFDSSQEVPVYRTVLSLELDPDIRLVSELPTSEWQMDRMRLIVDLLIYVFRAAEKGDEFYNVNTRVYRKT